MAVGIEPLTARFEVLILSEEPEHPVRATVTQGVGQNQWHRVVWCSIRTSSNAFLLLLALKGEHSCTESLGNNWIRVQLFAQYPVSPFPAI